MSRFECFKKNDGNKLIFISIPASDMQQSGDGQPYSETEKAYGFSFPNLPMVWIPKSQVKDLTKNFDNYAIEFWLPSWLVENKKLEKYKSTAFEPNLFEGVS